MAFRALLVLVTFCALMYGCDQASSPVEKQKKAHGAEQVGGGEEKGATGGTQNGESLKEAIRSDLEKVGEMQSESTSVSLEGFVGPETGVTFAHVQLKMGAGELNVTGGADADQLMEADFSYNVSAWKPKVSYRPDGEVGILTVRQGSVEGSRGGDARNVWDIRLNDKVPTHLEVEMGAGESNLDLDSLNLGTPGVEPTDLTVQMGAGETTVDLTGDYRSSLDASIQRGNGEATVLLPSEVGVRVTPQGGLGGNVGEINLAKINAKGLQRVSDASLDDSYVNDAYGESRETLRVVVQGGVGEINLEVV